MKIRTGFVSNSSSSSFVLETKNDHNTTWKVAQEMLRQREADGWNEDGEGPTAEETIRRIEALNLPVNTPFTMHSYNYETFIFKCDDKILIDTCNNHRWDISGEYTEYYGDEYKKYSDGDGLLVKHDDILFFHMDYLIVAKEAPFEAMTEYKKTHPNCTHSYRQLQIPDGTLICPRCEPPVPIAPFALEPRQKVNRLELID